MLFAALCCLVLPWEAASAQAAGEIISIDLVTGRSQPIQTPVPVTRASVANPEVADVVVVGERDVVINGRGVGETDVLLWGAGDLRRHYRVTVHSVAGRRQIVLAVKFAEVRRDFLAEFGVSGLYRDQHTTAGTGTFRSDNAIDPGTGRVNLGADVPFTTILTDFGTKNILALIQAEEQRGTARTLAEPKLMAANREDAAFLAGGELPIPIASGGVGGLVQITILWREFGVRLNFNGEILSDSLLKLKVRPEVSTLDYTNAIVLQGFRIPALRTRRMESTIDVRRDQSLIISGLLNDERTKTRTGVPLLMNIPILGALFSSTQWQRNETELLVVVTPIVVDDPMVPRSQDTIRLRPDTTLPARDAIQPKVQPVAPRRPGGPNH